MLIWTEKYRNGEPTLDVQRKEQRMEAEQQSAALERNAGQPTMELVQAGVSPPRRGAA